MSNIYLHPVSASCTVRIVRIEQQTGLVAVSNGRHVRLVSRQAQSNFGHASMRRAK